MTIYIYFASDRGARYCDERVCMSAGYQWDGSPSSADKPPQYFAKPPRPTQPPTLSGREMSTSQSAVVLCSWE